ncbi:uncharacterized protein [Clytia hemisphaerica]|uniref:uncharacterized protein n=1 Tax=Clytia hemisphaerica TaxID=252671 RepID=UPI0034D53EFB|eukprot:TCONS_00034281-protein
MAIDLLSKKDTNEYKTISKTLLTTIYGLMSKRKLTQENDKQNLLRELNVYQSKKETHKTFDVICSKTTTEEFKSLLNSLILNIMTEILKLENYKEKDKSVEVKLTTEEQQVLRYSAGYIIFSMRRKYFKLLKSNVELTKLTANGAMKFIESIIEEYDPGLSGETYLEFTQKWVELRNRGGLVQLNDNFYLFIRRVEGLVKGILTVEFLRRYRSEDLRDILMERIRKSDGVNNRWEILTKDFEGGKSLKDMLKRQIISKWIDIRARSFVKGFIELMKQVARKEKSRKRTDEESESNKPKGKPKNQTVANKAEVGFRKKLSK